MLRVLQILGDPTGGIRKHVHAIIRSSCGGEFEAYYAHGKTFDLVGKTDLLEFESGNIKCFALSIPKNPHYLDIWNIYLLIRYCQINKIKLVHGHGAKGGLYCRLVSMILGIPCIYTPHGGSVHARYGKLEGLLYRSVEKLLKPITDLYLFESNYTFNSFVAACGDLKPSQYKINYNGIDCESIVPTRRWSDDLKSEVNILVVGVLRDLKGQEIAIQALAKLAKIGNWNFRLHFCGDGPDRRRLESLVREYKLSCRVVFHGEVENIMQWYEMCSIVVIPSLFESFGYVAIEAAIMRRPVIAAGVGGLAEIVITNETGVLFPSGDSEALVAEVLKAISDVATTDALVAQADKYVRKNFSLGTMLRNIGTAYTDTANASRV